MPAYFAGPFQLLGIVSPVFAILSGFCWIKAARARVFWGGLNTYGGPAKSTIMEINSQSKWNAYAAWLAASAAIAQGVPELTSWLASHGVFA